MKDSLQICPKCGSDACYVTPINLQITNTSVSVVVLKLQTL
jgi:hypothetical protein